MSSNRQQLLHFLPRRPWPTLALPPNAPASSSAPAPTPAAPKKENQPNVNVISTSTNSILARTLYQSAHTYTTPAPANFVWLKSTIFNSDMRPTDTISLISSALIITVLALATRPAIALTCYCPSCPNESCETTDNNESFCFWSIARELNTKNNTYDRNEHYGCLSGNEGNLLHLQCFTKVTFEQPTMIKCCKDYDYCNTNTTDPTENDDKRWAEKEPPPQDDKSKIVVATWQAVLFLALVVVLLIIVFCRVTFKTIKIIKSRSSRASSGRASACFLENDIEKYHQHAISSGYNSTHSYSISEDLCHKSEPPEPVASEDSFVPTDLTSGLGEQVVQGGASIAKLIGYGQTDFVGNGRFGRVFRGIYHGEDVAVKAFRTIDQESWQREDRILRSLNHDNIVRFIASEVTSLDDASTEIWMFLEYCPFGSLCDYLDHNEILGPQQAVKILYSIINGLNYLHEDYAQASRLYKPSIAHRDIKSKNILMKSPESCCIADFGHALIKEAEDRLDYGKYDHFQVGTIRYMAPEILKPNSRLSYREFKTFAQADLYQYGLIMWEVLHRTALDILHPAGHHKLPYDGVVPQNPSIQDMIKIVCEDQYRPPRYPMWDKYPLMKLLARIMIDCWRPNPEARMQTLGVKKRIREIYDQVVPNNQYQFQVNLFNNFSLSPTIRYDQRDKTKSSDVTL